MKFGLSLTILIKHTEHQIKGSCWIELRPQAAANECKLQMGWGVNVNFLFTNCGQSKQMLIYTHLTHLQLLQCYSILHNAFYPPHLTSTYSHGKGFLVKQYVCVYICVEQETNCHVKTYNVGRDFVLVRSSVVACMRTTSSEEDATRLYKQSGISYPFLGDLPRGMLGHIW